MKIGYHLSSEEHDPDALIDNAVLAESLGFDSFSISDHFHPWGEGQGHSPFVWAVIGGLARATDRAEVGTLVTCPLLRTHPVLVAHAAATAARMLDGRFFLGLGAGERLNEHVLGQHWPSASRRQAMLEEAVEVIRSLWRGVLTSHHGEFYTVENAKLYDVPPEPPPICLAAAGPDAAELAGRIGDGLVLLSPDAELVEQFARSEAPDPRPAVGMTHVCWAPTRDEALETVRRWWPTAGLPGELNAELPLPELFEMAGAVAPDDAVADAQVLGDDPEDYVAEIKRYADAGFDRLWLHQIGPDQRGFLEFFADHVRPKLG